MSNKPRIYSKFIEKLEKEQQHKQNCSMYQWCYYKKCLALKEFYEIEDLLEDE